MTDDSKPMRNERKVFKFLPSLYAIFTALSISIMQLFEGQISINL